MENNQENIELEAAAEETEAVQEEKPDIEVISPEQLKIEALEKQLTEEKDKYLRVAAEYDNFRRRSLSDRQLAVSDAQSKVITEFLSVSDNFERALQYKERMPRVWRGGLR